jgi:hypothetical protein
MMALRASWNAARPRDIAYQGSGTYNNRAPSTNLDATRRFAVILERIMNRHFVVATALLVAMLADGESLKAQQASHAHSPAEAAAELAKARRRFSPELEQMKALAGRWEGTTFREREGTTAAVVTYEVTAAGSAVIEKLFPGTQREMTTVYHDDSTGRLTAEHYCNAANQPRLKLTESKGGRMSFVLSPDSDIKADLEGHAHELTVTLGADGSLTHDWLNHYLGKPGQQRNVTLSRSK